MTNKRKHIKYKPRVLNVTDPAPKKQIMDIVLDYYASHPELYRLDDTGYVYTQSGSELVSPGTQQKALQYTAKSWTGYKDYFRDGDYLGRVTVEEGYLISMELV